MDIADLSKLKDILCPNPLILLKVIGYSQKEVFHAVAEAQATLEIHNNNKGV